MDRVGRKGLADLKLTHNVHQRKEKNLTCTKGEVNSIFKKADGTEAIIRTAYKNWDKHPEIFKKWFGTIDAHDDENVKRRFKRAMDMMFAEKRNFGNLCCRDITKGSC
jgi:hypothetical protein